MQRDEGTGNGTGAAHGRGVSAAVDVERRRPDARPHRRGARSCCPRAVPDARSRSSRACAPRSAPRPRLLVKRDDAITFGFGGNKVRKIEMVAARALEDDADVLITTGGVQSNHCRVTAAAAARLGMRCVIVANGAPPERLTGNALLDQLFGAEVRYVASREERAPAMDAIAASLRAEGPSPGRDPARRVDAARRARLRRAVGELVAQLPEPPDYIFHSTSSGGTQAGLVAGCALARARHAGDRHQRRRAGGRASRRPCRESSRASATCSAWTARGSRRRGRSRSTTGFIGEGYGDPDRRVARGAVAPRPHRGARRRSHLHGEGAGGADRLGARGPLPRGRHGALLAHRGQVGVFA